MIDPSLDAAIAWHQLLEEYKASRERRLNRDPERTGE